MNATHAQLELLRIAGIRLFVAAVLFRISLNPRWRV
jgi:hypothetical protein